MNKWRNVETWNVSMKNMERNLFRKNKKQEREIYLTLKFLVSESKPPKNVTKYVIKKI